MVTNEERREVARKLRESRESVWDFRKELSDEGAYIHCDDQADYYLICKSVTGYIPCEYMHPCDYAELHDRIADLIEPEPERTCHDVTPWGDFFTCSECNGQVMLRPDVRWPEDGKILRTPTLIDGEGLGMRAPRFCPNCGAKVVDK